MKAELTPAEQAADRARRFTAAELDAAHQEAEFDAQQWAKSVAAAKAETARRRVLGLRRLDY